MSTQIVDISTLTSEQLKALRSSLLKLNKTDKSVLDKRNSIIDSMLQVKDADGSFKWTTTDIVAKLQEAKVVPATILKGDRQEWLKKVQTRKQLLERQTNEDGTLKHKPGTFGYKSSGTFGNVLTAERVTDWIIENSETLSATEKAAILKSLR